MIMNIDLSQFHFIRVYFLLLFPMLVWFIWRVYRFANSNNAWSKACDPGLLSFLLVGVEKKKGFFHLFLLFVVGTLLVVAAAGPTWQKLPQAVYKKESARVFVLDLSRSMDSTDITPSRTSRAKLKLIDFLEANDEGLAALVVYANLPHVVSPLTDDSNTIISMVPSLSTAIMPSGGGRADRAIQKAAQLLKQAGNNDGDIVLLTDGIKLSAATKVAEKISAMGFRLNVVGIGTEQGAPIPNGSNGFLKDNAGNIVVPKLNRQDLKALALAGSGLYSDITVDNRDIEKLTPSFFGDNLTNNSGINPKLREVDLWRDQGHWFLLLALPFAALSFRRGWLGAILVVSVLLPPQNAYALSWDDLWKNKNQQAQEKLNNGDVKAAAELFQNDQWKGAAQYKAGDFEKAAEAFSNEDTAESYYNLGNALARQGKLQEAIEAYNNTLERKSHHPDAEFNKALVQKLIDEESSDQEQESDENKESDEQDDSEKNQQDQENESDQQDDKDSEQNESDEENQSEEERKKEEQKKSEEEKKAEKEAEENKSEEEKQAEKESEAEQKELKQATEQWLRRIPDDPGGLLREKMRRQSLRDRQRRRPNTENQW